ncbi:hypothetical protein CIP107534_02015 [Corynebacterium diphtheriae]|nr:hypothetical protein CIP107533_01993 [Corynebacterium diphtheriae]CAB0575925.1 hypothetical protein CIP107534_02015 [Corynebacterium diphtheriae]CAB0664145.1 hypothetical protein CIP107580_01970 [Corynebacterium diphtheriae]CAB1007721.1 hypothetical protein FRC0497_01952 [Corynebacterium diphtheriae]
MFEANNQFYKVPARHVWGKVTQINGGKSDVVTAVWGSTLRSQISNKNFVRTV